MIAGHLYAVIFWGFWISAIPLIGQSQETHSTWTDSTTRLTWVASDNGSGISGRQAVRYCKDLRVGDFHDWALPSIEQLQTIFSRTENDVGYHVRGPLRLTGWQWSSTVGEAKGEQWSFDFGDGARASVMTGDSGLNRAICVRRLPAVRDGK